jgi:DNA-binding NtrC family response regulator
LFKPLRGAEVRFEINRLLSSRRKLNSNEKEVENKYIFHQSRNPQMAALYQASVEKIAKSDATILIQGESGTGKELMAYWIYTNSLRKTKPFVKVSCAVLPEGVLESELFGHERGSFTGAYSKRKGRFELADGGTIFLDEIGEISPAIQSKFLRVLQEKEFQRIGSNATIKVDVRVIAATSRDLKKEVERGHFREDLYYRLNVISLNIPPLRERKEDIPFLAEMFMKKYALRSQRILGGFENQALKLLTAYDWPGNVRELENAIERAVVLSTHNIITIGDLPNNIIQLLSEEPNEDLTLREAREKFEEEYIKNVLFRFKGNITQTARYLGLARKNLQEKVRKYNINAEEFR